MRTLKWIIGISFISGVFTLIGCAGNNGDGYSRYSLCRGLTGADYQECIRNGQFAYVWESTLSISNSGVLKKIYETEKNLRFTKSP